MPNDWNLRAERILRHHVNARLNPITVMGTPPTVTFGAANANSTIVTNASVYTTNGATYQPNDPLLTGLSCGPLAVAGNGPYITESGSPEGYGCGHLFGSDAEAIDFCIADNSTAKFRIKVNGQWIGTTDIVQGGSGTGANLVYVKLDWGTGNGALREYEIYRWQPPYYMKGINCGYSAGSTKANNIYKMFKLAVDEPPMIAFGDSYTYGNVSQKCRDTWAHKMGEFMGLRSVLASGAGGQGFLTTSNGSHYTFRQRIAQGDLAINGPVAAITFAGGINDATQTASALTTEVQACLAAMRAVQPNAFILGIGPWRGWNGAGGGTGTVPAAACYTAIATGYANYIAASGDRYVKYVDPTATVPAWQDTVSPGNCTIYIDPTIGSYTHPNALGHAYLGRRVADEWAKWMQSFIV